VSNHHREEQQPKREIIIEKSQIIPKREKQPNKKATNTSDKINDDCKEFTPPGLKGMMNTSRW